MISALPTTPVTYDGREMRANIKKKKNIFSKLSSTLSQLFLITCANISLRSVRGSKNVFVVKREWNVKHSQHVFSLVVGWRIVFWGRETRTKQNFMASENLIFSSFKVIELKAVRSLRKTMQMPMRIQKRHKTKYSQPRCGLDERQTAVLQWRQSNRGGLLCTCCKMGDKFSL